MKRHLSVLAILMVMPFSKTCFAQTTDSTDVVKSLMKCWRAFSHEYSTIYGLEEEEIKRYSKQKVCFTSDSIRMYKSTLYEPKFSVTKKNSENYAKDNFDLSKRNLGIRVDSVYEITISSITKSKNGKTYKMTDVLAFDGICIYVVLDGVIFRMLDADSKMRPRSSN